MKEAEVTEEQYEHGDPETQDDSSSGFYRISDLPEELQAEWANRMVYRIILRAPYPPVIWPLDSIQTVSIGLINEMSLFPRAKLATSKAHCTVQVMQVEDINEKCTSMEACVQALDPTERRWADHEDLSWPGLLGGKGAVSIQITRGSENKEIHRTASFFLKIEAVATDLLILPLILGPFNVSTSKSTNESLNDGQLLHFYRMVPLLNGNRHDVIIEEMPELAIPGKIWDSALFVPSAAMKIIRENVPGTSALRILDLSAGTGICGIQLAASISGDYDQSELVLTDVSEALQTIEANIVRNNQLLARTKVSIKPLFWGNSRQADEIGQFDIVLACDLIYESDLLEALVNTLDSVSMPGRTHVILGYKQRGLTRTEKSHVWGLLEDKFIVTRIGDDENTTKTAQAAWVGVELWDLFKE